MRLYAVYFCKLLYMLERTSNCSTIAEGSRDSSTSARCCNYSYMCSWWWVESPPETCREVYRNIMYIVASCWTIIDIDSRSTDPWT